MSENQRLALLKLTKLRFGAIALITVLMFFKSPNQNNNTRRLQQKITAMDFPGALLLVGSMACLVVGIQADTIWAWSDSKRV